MKHTFKVTAILILLFLTAQVVGLFIVDQYIDKQKTIPGKTVYKALPYNIERPDIKPIYSYLYILLAVLIGTGVLLLLIRFKKNLLWKTWYFLSVWIVTGVALSAFLNQSVSILIAFFLAAYKVLRPALIIQNLTEVLMYGGIAAIFVPILNLLSAFILLILISIYDMYAVWHSKHMIKLAQFQADNKVFPGLLIPYPAAKSSDGKKKIKSKIKTAILGGGDIAFPLLFAGTVMKSFGFLPTLIIPV